MLACAEGPKNSCLLDVQLALVRFFLPMEYSTMKSPWKTTLITRHDFDHLFRYDLKKNVATWRFVDQDWPFEAPGNMDAAVTLIQVGQLQFTAETIREETMRSVTNIGKSLKEWYIWIYFEWMFDSM